MNIIDLFKRTVAQHRDKVAIDDLSQQLTFAQLDSLSDGIACEVARRVKVSQQPVAILMDKSALTVAAFLGVAKAGCFYVPIGTDQPEDRVAQMMGVLNAPLVITDDASNLSKVASSTKTFVLSKEIADAFLAQPAAETKFPKVVATDPLYAIFTSGSTGTPKCVVVSHGSLVSFIKTFIDTFGITSTDTLANQAPFDFDISVKDIYSCMAAGASLVLIPRKSFSFPAQLLAILSEKRPTVLVWAVSAMIMISQFRMCDALAQAGFSPRTVMFSGEVMPRKHFESWHETFPATEFVNLYGPTEITCNCTFYRVPRETELEFPLPIGTAFAHNKVFLIDNDAAAAPGSLGEICVEGPNVALGYYRNPAQTRLSFTPNPLAASDAYRAIVYHTGDLASMGSDGLLRFAGRADNQVKFMGHRIELTEVESAFDNMPGISRCVCILNESANRLELHYTTDEASAPDINAAEFSAHASTRLPAPMTPKHFERHVDFPKTRNGKIDRKALKRTAEEQ